MCSHQKLDRLRGELDRVDDKILKLIETRLSLCTQIGNAKDTEGTLKLRPGRQRQVVERLVASSATASPELVRHVWRELMAHSVQYQAPTRFLLLRSKNDDQLIRLTHQAYGSAAPIEWADDPADALKTSELEDVIAVIGCDRTIELPPGVSVFDALHEDGKPVAWVVGRVERDEATDSPAVRPVPKPWHPGSWREWPASQIPSYEDRSALAAVEQRLGQRPPIVELHDIRRLRERFADVAAGKAIIIQGGDCAETFDGHSRAHTRSIANLIAEMAELVACNARRPVVMIGRIAGQYAKPRTNAFETVDGTLIPTYRGDAVNGRGATLAERGADPRRLTQAYDHSSQSARWLSDLVPDGLEPIFTSHEGLLLNYEQALTQYDELSHQWWAGSAHMLWIGERTRSAAGAHAEYLRGVINPVGIKFGPRATSTEVLELLDVVDPAYDQGKVALISRMGRKMIEDILPNIMREVKKTGRSVVWLVDPMHGNTQMIAGFKTRRIADVVSEIKSFHEVCATEGIWPGGIHLELTPDNVTECLANKDGVRRRDLHRRYETACDPRLNRSQSIDVAALLASLYGEAAAAETRS